MDRPHRVQLERTKGWRKPPNTIVVARPSSWGNPYRVVRGVDLVPLIGGEEESGTGGCWHVVIKYDPTSIEYPIAAWPDRESALASAVAWYRHRATEGPGHFNFVLYRIDALRGKNLACWCPLDQPCHADVLLELANTET